MDNAGGWGERERCSEWIGERERERDSCLKQHASKELGRWIDGWTDRQTDRQIGGLEGNK